MVTIKNESRLEQSLRVERDEESDSVRGGDRMTTRGCVRAGFARKFRCMADDDSNK